MNESGIEKDEITYNIIFHTYGHEKQFRKLKLYVTEMAESKVQPNLEIYNTLINVYGALARDFDMVEKYITEMNFRIGTGCLLLDL